MNLEKVLNTQDFYLYPDMTLFRVQRTKPAHKGMSFGPIHIAPPGVRCGRFDLTRGSTSYFALSPDTACYETLCRRDTRFVSLALLKQRELISMRVRTNLRLLDLEAKASTWPLLQSISYESTQRIADDAKSAGYVGIAYRSSQHHQGTCIALFEDVVINLTLVSRRTVVDVSQDLLNPAIATAIDRTGILLTP